MPETPSYYAVIFTSKLSENTNNYDETAKKMEALAKQQPGFLGIVSARDHIGITVSYWESLEAIHNWKQQITHLEAQQNGRNIWYNWYDVKICKVEKSYEFHSEKNT